MAATLTVKGLLRYGQQAFESTNYNAARNFQTDSVDDSAIAIALGDTAANSGGAITNFFDQAFDATPTESQDATSATITTVTTYAAGNANFTHKRTLVHDDTAANVTASSATNGGGVDGFSLAKTADFSMAYTKTYTATDNS